MVSLTRMLAVTTLSYSSLLAKSIQKFPSGEHGYNILTVRLLKSEVQELTYSDTYSSRAQSSFSGKAARRSSDVGGNL